MRNLAIATAFAISTATSFIAACDKAPTSPTSGAAPGSDVSGARIASVLPSVQRLELVGPAVVTLQETARFRLVAYDSDGSQRDLTNDASWYEDEYSVMLLSSPGVFTGNSAGEAEISARLDRGLSAAKTVIVVPAGTYRLAGTVKETGIPTGPVVGARVEATNGHGTRLIAETDQAGHYSFFGVAGPIRLEVTKDGYEPVTRHVDVADHNSYDVELPLLEPRADMSGSYTMTLTASAHCSIGVGESRLREDAHRVRVYVAQIRQLGPTLQVTLRGETLRPRPGHAWPAFGGRVEPGRVFLDFTGGIPFIVDDVTESGFLVVDGTAALTGSGDHFVGSFVGSFRGFDEPRGDVWTTPMAAWCDSTSHWIVLAR